MKLQKSNGTADLIQFPPMDPKAINESSQCVFVHAGIPYFRFIYDTKSKGTCAHCGKPMSFLTYAKHYSNGAKNCNPIALLAYLKDKAANREIVQIPNVEVADPADVAVFDAHNGERGKY